VFATVRAGPSRAEFAATRESSELQHSPLSSAENHHWWIFCNLLLNFPWIVPAVVLSFKGV
jgi:hypothetical protein